MFGEADVEEAEVEEAALAEDPGAAKASVPPLPGETEAAAAPATHFHAWLPPGGANELVGSDGAVADEEDDEAAGEAADGPPAREYEARGFPGGEST